MLLEDLKVVLKVAELQSITKAARQLDMSTPRASTALKRVEEILGAKLFIRSTRQLRLSSAGEKYIPYCEKALLNLEQGRQQISCDLDIVEGELRISVSSDLGRNLVRPWLNEFMDTYPDVRARVYLSDSNVDLFRDSIDMAIRFIRPGSLDDANLYGFKICNVPHVLCASAGYLAEFGIPTHPEELSSHNGVLYQLYDMTHDVWTFASDGEEFKVRMQSRLIANDGDMVRRWCVDGKGLAVKACLDVSADLLSGKLVSVMPEFKPSSTELWLLFPSRQVITPAARLLRDRIKENCSHILRQLIRSGTLDESVLE